MSSRATPLASVVVPTKNRPDSLQRLLRSVRAQDYPAIEVVVVDDGSTERLPDLGPDVVVLRNDESLGACVSRNRGAKAARGQFIFIFDDDAELVDPTAITRSIRWATERGFQIVSFRQTEPDGSTRGVNAAHTSEPVEVSVFFTYGCMLEASVLRDVPFRESLQYYFEEIDFSLRALERGYRIVFDPSLSVIHHEDPRGRNWERISRLSFRNMVITVLCDCPPLLIPPALAMACVNGVSAFRGRVGVDFVGKMKTVPDAIARFKLKDRDPVRFETFARYRRLRRKPLPVVPN